MYTEGYDFGIFIDQPALITSASFTITDHLIVNIYLGICMGKEIKPVPSDHCAISLNMIVVRYCGM
jgi:hypothetical protein